MQGTGAWEGYSATLVGAGWTPLIGAPPGYTYSWYSYELGDATVLGVTLTELRNIPQIGAGPPDTTGVFDLAMEWLFSTGEPNRVFGPSSGLPKELSTSPSVTAIRQEYCQQVAAGGPRYLVRNTRFGRPGGADGPFTSRFNMTRQFVGSFQLTIQGGGNGGATFTAYNITGLHSFLYGTDAVQDVKRGEGPLASFSQTFWWNEANPCGK